MGLGSSSQLPPEMHYEQHQPQFMDMNVLFNKGIPRIWQVADDMHRMTDYIMDLRNMTAALIFISTIGIIGFLLLRCLSKRNSKRRRRRSLRDEVHSLPRFYYQSQYGGGGGGGMPEAWDRPKSTFSHHSMDEKQALESRNSPEEKRHQPNGNLTYKSYNTVNLPDEMEASQEKKMSDSFHAGMPSGAPPTPSYLHSTSSQKRPPEPVKLRVEELPFVDTTPS